VKLLLIGGLAGLVIGVVLTFFYFSLATFFAVNAKALEGDSELAENANKNAEDKSKPGRVGQGQGCLGREFPLPAKVKSRKSKGVLR
jgi:hypothetical protein